MEVQKINQTLKQSSSEKKAKTKDPVELFRLSLLSGGAGCIKGIGRTFRISDRDKSRSIDMDEFKVICQRRKVDLKKEQIRELFDCFDKDGSGRINFDEFLQALRPPMSEARLALVNRAFQKMDQSGDGVITVDDLIKTYDVRQHPKFKNGEMTKKQVIAEFLDSFELDDHVDESQDDDNKPADVNIQITKEEWHDYFVSVSSSCDTDLYFSLMMRSAWGIE